MLVTLSHYSVSGFAISTELFIEYSKILEDFLRSRLNTFTAGADKRRRSFLNQAK